MESGVVDGDGVLAAGDVLLGAVAIVVVVVVVVAAGFLARPAAKSSRIVGDSSDGWASGLTVIAECVVPVSSS